MIKRSIGILGAGGQAKEIAAFYRMSGRAVGFYAVDQGYVDPAAEDMIAITSPTAVQREMPVIISVGAPGLRLAFEKIWPGSHYDTFIDPSAWIADTAQIGIGSVVAPLSFISHEVTIGRHVLVNGVRVHHNTEIGDFSVLCPGAHIGGGVRIGRGVFVGAGAIIIQGSTIASGTYIGAGAVVTKSIVQENSLAVGIPAIIKKVRKPQGEEGWPREV